jgi:hypothetical protein
LSRDSVAFVTRMSRECHGIGNDLMKMILNGLQKCHAVSRNDFSLYEKNHHQIDSKRMQKQEK